MYESQFGSANYFKFTVKLLAITVYTSNKDLFAIEKKERKKSLTRGHVKDIGSATGIQFYSGQGYEGDIAGKCLCDFPVPPSLRNGCALRNACRARPMSVCGGHLLMGGMMMRWGWDRVCSAIIPSRQGIY